MTAEKKTQNLYRKGRIAEKKVENWLAVHKFTNIRRSKGSRGPADIYARSPAGTKSYIQVKSGTARMTKEEKRNLRHLAKNRRGFAAEVHKGPGNDYRMKPLGNWSIRKNIRKRDRT